MDRKLEDRTAVARRFRGEFHQKVDGKGRVSIPSRFRRVVELGDPDWSDGKRPNLIVVYGLPSQRSLDCYTVEAMEEIDARIDLLQPGSKQRKLLERIFQGHSLEAVIDEDGRIVLPARQRDKIGLESEAYFIAAGDHFEIWKPETYAETEVAKAEAWLEEQEEAQDEDFDPRMLLPPVGGGGAR